MDDSTVSAITQAANEAGLDPAFALSVAQRESDFDPGARASKTIYGLFQMSADERNRWGGASANSSDPYTQAKMWGAYINGQVKPAMQNYLGREPTNSELYLGHYFGENRAARMIGGAITPDTNVGDVFTRNELMKNPNIVRAGNVGALMKSISDDMDNRTTRFGGRAGPVASPERYAEGNTEPPAPTSGGSDYYKSQMALGAGANKPWEEQTPGIGSSLANLGREVEEMDHPEEKDQAQQQAAAVGGEAFANARSAANYRAAAAAQRPISLPGNEVNLEQFGIPTSPMRPGQANLPQVIGQPPQQQQQQIPDQGT